MQGAGLRPGFVNQQPWELSCLLLDGGTRAGRGYMGFVAMVSCLTQGDTLRQLFSPGTAEGAWEEEVSRALGQCRVAR